MNATASPVVARSLEELRRALAAAGVPPAEGQDIQREIENHLSEMVAHGTDLPDALARLGPAAQLGRAYGLELLLNPRPGPVPLRVHSIVARGTRLLAGVLGLIVALAGLGLLAGGVVGAIGAVVGPWLPFDPTLRAGLPQVVALVASLVLAGVGGLLLRLVFVFFRAWRRSTLSMEKPR